MTTLKEQMAAIKTRQDEIAAAKEQRDENGRFVTKSTTPKASEVFGASNHRRGENPMSSRGFRFGKFFKAMAEAGGGSGVAYHADAWAEAVPEREVGQMFEKAFRQQGGSYLTPGSFLAPMGTDLLPDGMAGDSDFGVKLKSLVYAGAENADPDEVDYIRRKSYSAPGQKASTLRGWAAASAAISSALRSSGR
jgi:hypothetical protein